MSGSMREASRAQCYKTFYSCNLQVFVKSSVIVPGRIFELGLMFAGKAGAYPCDVPLTCTTLG
jgi:hypothetical protein